MANLSRKRYDEMVAHDYVNVTASASQPHIASISFTKSAFHKQHWDEVTTRARGLFVNRDSLEIVARGYDKFFNMGERPETQLETALDRFSYPVQIWVKYNGFLGITGYDAEKDQLLIGSKSRLEGPFADMFREILTDQIGAAGLERLRRALRDLGASATFEVIDPVRDPHIVAYDHAQVILLDVIRRHAPETGSPDRLNYEELKAFAAHVMGSKSRALPVKERLATIENADAMRHYIERYLSPARERHGEGLVLEDASGWAIKIKSPWYSHWKRARSHVNRVVELTSKGKPLPDSYEPEHQAFMDWARRQPIETLRSASIIELRDAWQGKTPLDINHSPNSDEMRALQVAQADENKRLKVLSGIERGLDQLTQAIEQGRANPASIGRMLQRGREDPVIQQAIDAHPKAHLLVEPGEA